MFVESLNPSVENCDECAVGIVFELPESISYVNYLRRKARRMMETLDISRQDTDDIEVIVYELATNAVRHARGGMYHVRIDISSGQATIVVIDNGIGFIPDDIPAPGEERPDTLAEQAFERIGGFGLPLVRCLSDRVEILPNPAKGMTVRAVKNLQPKL